MTQPKHSKDFTILFLIYDGITQLDFTGPLQFLSRIPNSTTLIASPNGGTVKTDCVSIADTIAISGVQTCDLLCIPGGRNAVQMANNDAFIGEVKRLSSCSKYITSVCTGSLILGAAGLLKNKKATTHWAWQNALENLGAILTEGRVVRDGNIFTGGGVTAGIDFALTLVAEVAGEDFAKSLQLALEYSPAPPFSSGSPATAEDTILSQTQIFFEQLLLQDGETIKKAAAKLN